MDKKFRVFIKGMVHKFTLKDALEPDFCGDADKCEQYIGLKDMNGVEIYENDIVECWTSNAIGGVEQSCKLVASFDYHSFLAITASENQLVIGNTTQSNDLII